MTRRVLQADHTSQEGYRAQQQRGGEQIALARYRRANALAPAAPVNQYSLGAMILRTQTQQYRASNYRQFDTEAVRLAIELLNRAKLGFSRPQVVEFHLGQAAYVLMKASELAGDREVESRFARIAAENLLSYRETQGSPEAGIDPSTFYRQASEAFVSDPENQRLDLVVLFWRDYAHYFGEDAITNPAYREKVIVAATILGLHPFVLLEIRRAIERDPAALENYELLKYYAESTGDVRNAYLLLEGVAERRPLPPRANTLFEALRRALERPLEGS